MLRVCNQLMNMIEKSDTGTLTGVLVCNQFMNMIEESY